MSDGRNVGIHLVPGALLAGRYKITRCISSSVTGTIYLAEDLNFARHPVTVKEMPGVFTREPPLVTQDNFKREFEVLFKLDHPSILKIYKCFFDTERGRFYLVMKYFDGSYMVTRQLQSGGRVDELTVTKWAIDICDALDYIHSQEPPFIYRDLTPDNLMIDGQTNRVMLVDFWFSRIMVPMREASFRPDITGYSPPEQYAGNFETRSDIYSLGATMFHLLTGHDPDDSALLIFDFTKHPKPRQLNPAITPEMEEMICKAVEFNPENRFASARAFGKQLKEHLHDLQR